MADGRLQNSAVRRLLSAVLFYARRQAFEFKNE